MSWNLSPGLPSLSSCVSSLSFTSRAGSASWEESSVSWKCLLKCCGPQIKGKNILGVICAWNLTFSTPTHMFLQQKASTACCYQSTLTLHANHIQWTEVAPQPVLADCVLSPVHTCPIMSHYLCPVLCDHVFSCHISRVCTALIMLCCFVTAVCWFAAQQKVDNYFDNQIIRKKWETFSGSISSNVRRHWMWNWCVLFWAVEILCKSELLATSAFKLYSVWLHSFTLDLYNGSFSLSSSIAPLLSFINLLCVHLLCPAAFRSITWK